MKLKGYAKVHDQAFTAGVNHLDMPDIIVPDKLPIERNLLAGSFTSMMPPKVAVKVTFNSGIFGSTVTHSHSESSV